MRDLVSKLFGLNQQESATEIQPGTVSEVPAAVPISGEEQTLVDDSDMLPETVFEPSEPAETQDAQESAATDVTIPGGFDFADEMPDLDSIVGSDDQFVDSPRPATASSIEDTALSLKPPSADRTLTKVPLLQAAQFCHIGNIRNRNEDSTYIFTAEADGQEPLIPFGLYIVADGMGGHHAGHEASRDVSRLVAHHVLERIYLPLLKKSISNMSASQEPIREVMLDAVQLANKHINNGKPGLESGTTLTAALVFGRRLYIAHIGDSRAYVLTDGQLKQITTDHSIVRRLQDAGQLTAEEAAVHPQRNMLYKAVGQGGELDIDTFTQTLPKDGFLFLCSDGLWGLVPDSQIKDVIQRDQSLQSKTKELINKALIAGGHDNISAVLVAYAV